MLKKVMFAAPLLAAACAPGNYTPAVSEYNGDSVKIQIDQYASYLAEDDKEAKKVEMQAMAQDICRRGHKKRAEYVSQRHVSTGDYSGYYERLYLCLN